MSSMEWIIVLVMVSLIFICASTITAGLVSSMDKETREIGLTIGMVMPVAFIIVFLILAIKLGV